MAPFPDVDDVLFGEDFDVPEAWAVVALGVELDGGAAFARDTTLFHWAAEFALVSFGLTSKYDASPWLSS